jgi:hypothetical protein
MEEVQNEKLKFDEHINQVNRPIEIQHQSQEDKIERRKSNAKTSEAFVKTCSMLNQDLFSASNDLELVNSSLTNDQDVNIKNLSR